MLYLFPGDAWTDWTRDIASCVDHVETDRTAGISGLTPGDQLAPFTSQLVFDALSSIDHAAHDHQIMKDGQAHQRRLDRRCV